MKRGTVALIVTLVALVAAGCGSGKSGGGSPASVQDLLGYLPADTPFVVQASTDPGDAGYKNLDKIAGKFPFSGQLKGQLKQEIEKQGVSYDKDIKPLLGGDAVLGAVDPRSLMQHGDSPDSFIGAVSTRDGAKLKELLEKKGQVRRVGQRSGAPIYQGSGDRHFFAIDGSTLVAATSRPLLEAALERHDGGEHLTKEKFDAAFNGLPADAIARFYLDLKPLLAAISPHLQKYVAGVGSQGLTLGVRPDRIELDGQSSGAAGGLALAPGDESPGVARAQGDFGIGWRDLRQTIQFYEQLFADAAPAKYKDYGKQKKALGVKLGIDFDRDVIAQLSGNSYASIGFQGWAVRSDVKDPVAAGKTLAKLAGGGRDAGLSVSKAGAGFFRVVGKDGTPVFVGVVGKSLVAGSDAGKAAALAATDPAPVEGARGAIAMNADAEALVNDAIRKLSDTGSLGSFFTGAIGAFNGWATSSQSGSRAHFELKID